MAPNETIKKTGRVILPVSAQLRRHLAASKRRVLGPKNFKKVKKRLATYWRLPLQGGLRATNAHISSFKKNSKK